MEQNDMLLNGGMLRPITDEEARFKNPLVLAYIGDTIYDLYIRTTIVKKSGKGINDIHRASVSMVNAKAQAHAAEKLTELFTEEESDIFRRGRNAKSGIPKNMSPADYHAATGLEAVIGYLYLTGRSERIEQLFGVILG